MLLFFSCQELVNNDQQRALTSRTPPRESSKSPTRAVSWVNRLFCSETDCTRFNRIIPSVGVNGRGRFTMGDLRRYKLQGEIQNARWNDNQASPALAGSAQGTRRYPVSAQ